MNKKRFGVVGFVAAAALAVSGLAVPTANAANTIVVWADEQRGPQLQKLIDGNKTIAPGYTIQVKFFSALDALQSAWDKSTAAGGPDIITGPASFASQGAKSGKLARLGASATITNSIPKAGLSAMSYSKGLYGVPLDVDTTAFLWNKTLFGASAPATFADMVSYYTDNKSAKGLTGGICAFEGTWGSHAVLTALGGGAWALNKNGTANMSTVALNSKAFKANVKKYLLDSSGKSTGFFQWDGCGDAFKAGKIPFAITGAWNFDGIEKAGIKFGLGATPGLTSGTKGAQWVNYSGAFLTSYASSHGVSLGANKVIKWFASEEGQTKMSALSGRPPANTSAANAVTNPNTLGVAKAALTGTPQISPALDNKTGGSNWYDVLGGVYTDIFTKGKSVDSTLDAAAAILAKNFANYATNG